MICPNCGKTVPNDEMFCKSCGTAIKESKKKAFVVNIPDEEEEEIAVSAEEAENILLKVPEHTVDEESAETAEIEETPDEGGNAEAEQDEEQPEEDTAENDAERSAEAEPAADSDFLPVQNGDRFHMSGSVRTETAEGKGCRQQHNREQANVKSFLKKQQCPKENQTDITEYQRNSAAKINSGRQRQ